MIELRGPGLYLASILCVYVAIFGSILSTTSKKIYLFFFYIIKNLISDRSGYIYI